MIFVDTGAWFAASSPGDPDHGRAIAWMAKNREPLLTTDYVIDELLTLLTVRGMRERAVAIGEQFLSDTPAHVHFVAPDDFRAAFEVFRRFRDKSWSFTDCVSYVIIKNFEIQTAFAFDDHFRQFGNVTVVPKLQRNKPAASPR